MRTPLNGTQHIEWYLLDENDRGYYISWLEAAADTGLPECMAFKAGLVKDNDARVISWSEKAVSHDPDAALALDDVLKQLVELYDFDVSVGDPDGALRPGEVVAGAK